MKLKSIKNRIDPIVWWFMRSYVGLVHKLPRDQKLFDWRSVTLKRTDVIKTLSELNRYTNYLEIGCQNDTNFAKVPFANKIGVDPSAGGTHRMTSDAFFADNKQMFDIVFIDGMHSYEQVRKDVYNSLKFLNVGGTIVMHDLLPTSWEQEHMPRLSRGWNGSTWKIAYELKALFGPKFGIIMADEGLGVVFKDTAGEVTPPSAEVYEATRKKTYNDFLKDYKSFGIVKAEDAAGFLRARKLV